MNTVLIAGASGYLGRYLCAEYQRRGWYVTALVRAAAGRPRIAADQLVEAEATKPHTLTGAMTGSELVISCLGITRQTDGLDYRDVDYQANLNLLREAERAGVERFAYVHVVNASALSHVPMVAAKSAFVEELRASAIASTVIAPTGYFSDMVDFLAMARSGRVWLFGTGEQRINPIHGEDLAEAIADVIEAGRDWCDIGGPDLFTQVELAKLAFEALDKPARIVRLPDALRRFVLTVLPWVPPTRIHGPARFFLNAIAHDMVGEAYGRHSLGDHFTALAGRTSVQRETASQSERISE